MKELLLVLLLTLLLILVEATAAAANIETAACNTLNEPLLPSGKHDADAVVVVVIVPVWIDVNGCSIDLDSVEYNEEFILLLVTFIDVVKLGKNKPFVGRLCDWLRRRTEWMMMFLKKKEEKRPE